MTEIYLFGLFLFIGWLSQRKVSDEQKDQLKFVTYASLLVFVSFSLWLYGMPENAFMLLLVGGLLQLTPTILGIFLENHSYKKSFLLFGTFGGGSRGMLALSILSPALLPVFIIIDLGNFLALILFYPILLRIGLQEFGDQILTKLSFWPLLISLLAITTGLILNKYAENINITTFHFALKQLLIGFTSFQIGIYLNINLKCILWTLKSLLMVRFTAILLPLLMLLGVSSDIRIDTLLVILLFAILPVSSIAVSLLPKNTESTFQESLSCAVTASTLIFISILMGLFTML